MGMIEAVDPDGALHLHQKNKFSVGEELQVMGYDGENIPVIVERILNEDGEEQESAPHPQQALKVYFRKEKTGDIIFGMLVRRVTDQQAGENV